MQTPTRASCHDVAPIGAIVAEPRAHAADAETAARERVRAGRSDSHTPAEIGRADLWLSGIAAWRARIRQGRRHGQGRGRCPGPTRRSRGIRKGRPPALAPITATPPGALARQAGRLLHRRAPSQENAGHEQCDEPRTQPSSSARSSNPAANWSCRSRASLAAARSPTRWWCASRPRPQSVGPRPAVRRRRHEHRQGIRHAPRSPVVTAPHSRAAMMRDGRPRSTSRCRSATKAPAWWSPPGRRAAAQALLGKTVAVLGGAMYSQYRTHEGRRSACCCPQGTTPAEGASCFVNPLTALGMVETMRREGHTALVHTAAASNLGQMLQPHLPEGRRRAGEHRAQAGAGGAAARASARRTCATRARPRSWRT